MPAKPLPTIRARTCGTSEVCSAYAAVMVDTSRRGHYMANVPLAMAHETCTICLLSTGSDRDECHTADVRRRADRRPARRTRRHDRAQRPGLRLARPAAAA